MSKVGLNATSAGSEETRKALSAIKVQTAPVHVGDSSYEELIPEESVNITIGIFIDGTLNNRDNTNARLAYKKATDNKSPLTRAAKTYKNAIDTVKKDLRGSYENDLSNVARMEAAYKKIGSGKQLQDRVYTEGIGSTTGVADDEKGMGLGTGPTGVPKKVEKSCIDAAKKIKTLYKSSDADQINILQIDVFGFSRGAAAARNFVFEITRRINSPKTIFDDTDKEEKKAKKDECYEVDYGELGVQLESKGITEIKQLVIRFVGLYETVASYGILHGNDTSDLHLNAIRKPKHINVSTSMYNTRHVFQLVAQDEHRKNFRLTNIKSAGSNGVEKFLPGVHSDIGGGYTDNAGETNLILKEPSAWSWKDKENAEAMRDQLVAQGWYKAGQLSIDADDYLRLNRIVASKKYSYIPLHLMVEYADKKKVLFDMKMILDSYQLNVVSSVLLPDNTSYSASLESIKERLEAHICNDAPRMQMTNPEDEKMLRLIRSNYIHTSAHYNRTLIKKVYKYPAHMPNDSYLTRKRKENNG